MTDLATKNKTFNLGYMALVFAVIAVVGLLVYATEFSKAKSWDVNSLVKCTEDLNDRNKAIEYLNQVGEQPKQYKIKMLNDECKAFREDERSKLAMTMVKEALKKNT